MIVKFHIVVEGEEDENFLMGYMSQIFGDVYSSVSIKNLKGEGNLESHAQKMRENLKRGIKNLVIFDANSNPGEKKNEIRGKLDGQIENVHDVPLFLFPDNESQGALESILVDIILPEHDGVFECFEVYKKCLKGKNSAYALPDMKGKVYAYKEAIGALCGSKENQFNPRYWDFSHPALNSLRKFLTEHIE